MNTDPTIGPMAMPRKHLHRFTLASIGWCLATIAVLSAGCTSTRHAEFTPLTSTRYAPREDPATVFPAQAEALPDKGYVLVGIVEARAPVRVCADGGCVQADLPPDTRQAARKAAAEGGGDLLVLELDAVLIHEPLEERGECLEMVRPMRDGDSLCSQWEWEYGIRESQQTRGTVWRLESALAANGANRLARQVFQARGAAPQSAPSSNEIRR